MRPKRASLIFTTILSVERLGLRVAGGGVAGYCVCCRDVLVFSRQ